MLKCGYFQLYSKYILSPTYLFLYISNPQSDDLAMSLSWVMRIAHTHYALSGRVSFFCPMECGAGNLDSTSVRSIQSRSNACFEVLDLMEGWCFLLLYSPHPPKPYSQFLPILLLLIGMFYFLNQLCEQPWDWSNAWKYLDLSLMTVSANK